MRKHDLASPLQEEKLNSTKIITKIYEKRRNIKRKYELA